MSGRTGKWGKPEWQKAKYQPTPETHKGKVIFHNETHLLGDSVGTPNGQDVKLKIGSTEVRLAPRQQYAYQPRDNRDLRIVAKPQLTVMKKAEATISHPLSLEDHHIEILGTSSGGKICLMLRRVNAH